jgi:hypothetical protein
LIPVTLPDFLFWLFDSRQSERESVEELLELRRRDAEDVGRLVRRVILAARGGNQGAVKTMERRVRLFYTTRNPGRSQRTKCTLRIARCVQRAVAVLLVLGRHMPGFSSAEIPFSGPVLDLWRRAPSRCLFGCVVRLRFAQANSQTDAAVKRLTPNLNPRPAPLRTRSADSTGHSTAL